MLRLEGQTLAHTGGPAAAMQFTWQATGVHEAKAWVRRDLQWANWGGLWAVFRFFGQAHKSHANGPADMFEWMPRVLANQPMTLPNGNPMTIRYEVDMGNAPRVFQKDFFSSMRCVADIAKY
jgi:type VI protein secretion system component VasK